MTLINSNINYDVVNQIPGRERTAFAQCALVYSKLTGNRYYYTRWYSYLDDKIVMSGIKQFFPKHLGVKAITYNEVLGLLNSSDLFRKEVTTTLSDKLIVTGISLDTYLTKLNEIEESLGKSYVKDGFTIECRNSFILRNLLTEIRTQEPEVLLSILNNQVKLDEGYSLFESTGVAVVVYISDPALIKFVFKTGVVTYCEQKVEYYFTCQSKEPLKGGAIMEWLPQFAEDVFITFTYLLNNLIKPQDV